MRDQNQNCGQWLKGLGWQKREIIISDEELRQKMSRILWQLCYRELPEIETLHTEGGKTDMDFFVRVKKSCIEKLEITLKEVSIIREAGGNNGNDEGTDVRKQLEFPFSLLRKCSVFMVSIGFF